MRSCRVSSPRRRGFSPDQSIRQGLYFRGFRLESQLAQSQLSVIHWKLNDLIDQRGLTQVETAHLTGMTQPKVSQVRRYRLQNISLERLMQALVSLDQRVEIVVWPARRAHGGGITVAG